MISNIKTIVSDRFDPYYNLALEEYLTFSVGDEECILYLWQNKNTVVIGKNQNAYRECNVTKLENDGGHLARRLSGGGAVYHDDGNLNFTFCVRKHNYDVIRQLNVILRAVRSFGINAEKTGRNDIAIDGKKFSGNAYYDSNDYAYHHGCIMVNANTGKLADFLNVSEEKLKSKGVTSVKSRVVNLSELNPEVTVDTLKKAILKAFEEEYALKAAEIKLNAKDKAAVDELYHKYSDDEWLFGRFISFTHTFAHRFSFGELEAHLNINNGKIKSAQIHTDAMDIHLAEHVEKLLTGLSYRQSEVRAAADETKDEIDREILLYLCEII